MEKLAKKIEELNKIRTLKKLFEFLKKEYKYVRLMELTESVRFSHCKKFFNRFILVSNHLKYYNETEMEIEEIKVKIEIFKASVRIILDNEMLSIPILELVI